jgi:hypothetical protein
MCGRSRRTQHEEELATPYGVKIPPTRDVPISWNVALQQDVLAVRRNPARVGIFGLRAREGINLLDAGRQTIRRDPKFGADSETQRREDALVEPGQDGGGFGLHQQTSDFSHRADRGGLVQNRLPAWACLARGMISGSFAILKSSRA